MFSLSRWSLPLHSLGSPDLARVLSSKASVLKDTLKHRLRDLYKKVHPDLFHDDNPDVRLVNERSFKLLQEYLAAAEHRAGSGGAASLPYNFNFYVKHHARDGQPAEVPQKISLTLPPPNRSLPHATHEALNRLLTACGVSTAEGGEEEFLGGGPTTLREFIPGAAEALHAAATQHGGPRHELSAVRTALQLSRRISLVFGPPLTQAGALEQAAAARQLLDIVQMDSCPSLATGLRIGLGGGFGTDSLGTLWLPSTAGAQAWIDFLQKADLEGCHDQKRHVAAIRQREHATAKALGVSMILAHPHVASSQEYESFLERAAGAPLLAAGGSGLLSNVSLRVEEAALDEDSEGRTDEHGKVCVPVNISTPALVAALRKLGPRAAREAHLADKEESELAALRRQVERALKLRLLARDPSLPAHKFRAGCLRLLHHSETLGRLLDGLPVRLSEVNGFVPGSSHIDISWSFTP